MSNDHLRMAQAFKLINKFMLLMWRLGLVLSQHRSNG
jgi:hypothetical protein